MPASRCIIAAAVTAVALVSGCAEPRLGDEPHLDGETAGRCYDCHGDRANGNTAPPPMRLGDEVTDSPDPHQIHLQGSDIHDGVACSDCHVVPTDIYDEAHINDGGNGAEITWDGLATAAGASPSFDAETLSCSGTYCHGGTLASRPVGAVDPVWEEPEVGLDCASCHMSPPAAPHTQATDCQRCHSEVAGVEMTIANTSLHVDGNLQLDEQLPCDGCHGGDEDPAPPTDTLGNTDTTFRGVGAHQAHTSASDWHAEIPCETCHVVPDSWEAPGHMDSDLPAEITWGGIADHDDATPEWDGTSCSNAYCHGSTLDGGLHPEPQWTLVDGTQASCDSCHGAPPPEPHPVQEDCGWCHGEVIGSDGTFVNPALHVDGVLQVDEELPCDSCHGGDGDPAPPTDTQGNTDTTFRGVGAHQVHLLAGDLHDGLECVECHSVPDSLTAVGHVDSALPAEITWNGELAGAAGSLPEWDGVSCSNTYCHAGPAGGGLHPEPEWTLVDGSQTTCDSCHGAPPPAPHPPAEDCALCHGEVVTAAGAIADVSLHVDGEVTVDRALACDTCHGSDGDPAPPTALDGATSPADPGVGAHQAHLGVSDWHATVACNECHVVPSDYTQPGHYDQDGVAELSWGRLATWGLADPVYEDGSCSNTYCHGGTFPARQAGVHTSPTWTLVDGSQTTCGSCHGDPPGGGHPAVADCSVCHGEVIASDGTFLAPELHIDGRVQVGVAIP